MNLRHRGEGRKKGKKEGFPLSCAQCVLSIYCVLKFCLQNYFVSNFISVWYIFLCFHCIFFSFSFQMLSSFPIPPPETPYPLLLLHAFMRVHPMHLPNNSHLPALPFPYIGESSLQAKWPRASSPIDALKGHPWVHISLEPWVPSYVLLGWHFRLWELCKILSIQCIHPLWIF